MTGGAPSGHTRAPAARLYRVADDERVVHALLRDGELHEIDGDVFGDYRTTAPIPGGLDRVRVLPPVAPSKIVAVGLNYRDHAAEQGKPLPSEPLIFVKPSTAIIGPGDPIRIPPGAGRVDHEGEMGLVIGRRAHRVGVLHAPDYILGITCVNDVTARDIQRKEGQYTRAKGFDTFAPIGPCVALGLDPRSLGVECWVNGVRRQASSTEQLIFRAAELVSFISEIMTLLPGDIISTGTPAGIGPLAAGDTVTVRVTGVGDLVNTVVEA
jgi:2-keto-4-pentenoate hydratase/2-oxohepta-3-ene-1,7-dioic acid hydratase in catechol pathway